MWTPIEIGMNAWRTDFCRTCFSTIWSTGGPLVVWVKSNTLWMGVRQQAQAGREPGLRGQNLDLISLRRSDHYLPL